MTVSYGRAEAIFQWANANWQEFDGWCCSQNINPIDLPAYRFYNLVMWYLKDDKTDEGLQIIEQSLSQCDKKEHPFKKLAKKVNVSQKESTKPLTLSDKHDYVPPWWRGDTENAAVALTAMQGITALPKMDG